MNPKPFLFALLAAGACAHDPPPPVSAPASNATIAAVAVAPPPSAAPSVTASAAPTAPPAVDVVVQPGAYGESVHVTADGAGNILTVAYSSMTGWDENSKAPRFVCSYYVAARLLPGRRKNTAIAFNGDEPRTATVEVLGPTSFRIHVDGGPLDGAMALPPDDDVTKGAGVTFDRPSTSTQANASLPFRHVTAKTADLRDHADGTGRTVKLDGGENLLTLDNGKEWLHVQSFGETGGGQHKGWVRTSDLAPLP